MGLFSMLLNTVGEDSLSLFWCPTLVEFLRMVSQAFWWEVAILATLVPVLLIVLALYLVVVFKMPRPPAGMD